MQKIMNCLANRRVQLALLAAVVLAGLLYPVLFPGESYMLFLLCMFGIYVIVNTGFDLSFGYSGQISLGQAGFYAIGAYVTAFLSFAGVPVLLSMFVSAAAAAFVGFLLSKPCVKLVHHFLAIVTIGFGEIVRLIVLNGGEFTGGPDGLIGIPSLRLFGVELREYGAYFYFVLAMALLFVSVKSRLVNSRVGRAFLAIRGNPDAGEAFGLNLSRYKSLAFTFAAFYAGFGGALYAHLVRFISPESFSAEQSNMFLVMILIGGMGTLVGPVLGSGIIIVVSEFLQQFGSYQMLIYGLMIIFVLFVMPNGIAGTIRSRYYHQFVTVPPRRSAAPGPGGVPGGG
ncbi:MAG: branched-chain amino acid ABC transporter permease [Clostridiaceae bacterium]|nr:branched-chain amino acid ABC transporter permease [Clostridiaceae bacterium]MCI9484706.1 branched-chain amino acid ABC transporter permease [Clostridiaceae bacterium]